jgi:hypothetical protein
LLTGQPGTEDLLFRPATELAALVRSGELSARALVEASLRRIEAVDSQVNAFTLVDTDGALAAADAIGPGDGRPFAGVPIGIKDLAAPVAGLVMSDGSDLYGDYTPDYDANVVRRIREAGFVIVGKTSSPELGIVPVTEPRRFGPTRNPWDLDRTPGGSAGGSGADRPRQRRRRVDPDPRGMLWTGGPQAQPRARVARAGPRRRRALHRRDAHPHRGGLRPLARRDLRL